MIGCLYLVGLLQTHRDFYPFSETKQNEKKREWWLGVGDTGYWLWLRGKGNFDEDDYY
jgi:hypothetical protein